MVKKSKSTCILFFFLIKFTLSSQSRLGYRPTITYEDVGSYNSNAQSGYDSNAQGFGGY
jgi:hypothetical protein